MTAKILLILLGLGATAMALLAQRQQRIDSAYELTRIHARCDDIRTSLWGVRRSIAQEIVNLKPQDDSIDRTSSPQIAQNKPEDRDGINGG